MSFVWDFSRYRVSGATLQFALHLRLRELQVLVPAAAAAAAAAETRDRSEVETLCRTHRQTFLPFSTALGASVWLQWARAADREAIVDPACKSRRPRAGPPLVDG